MAAAVPGLPEESDATIWKWMGADSHPKQIDMVIRQQTKLLGEHSSALASGMTGLARITRRLDQQVMAIALKVAEHEGTQEAMTSHPHEWLISPASSRAATPAAGTGRPAASPATNQASTPVHEPAAAAAAALEAEIAEQEAAEQAAAEQAAKAAQEAAEQASAARAAQEVATAAEEAAVAEAEQKRIEHEAACEAAEEAERVRLDELERARLEAAEKQRLQLQEETRKAAEAAAIATAAEEAAAAKAAEEKAAAAKAAKKATPALTSAPEPVSASAPSPSAPGTAPVRSIAANSDAIAKLQSTVKAEAKGRLQLYDAFTAHVKSMDEFQVEVRDALSKLRWQGDENDKRLRGLDLRVTKVERPSNTASVSMGLPEALPDALEFIETQVRQLERKLKNVESGMDAENPLAAELDQMLKRVHGVESHTQRQSHLLDRVVHQLEAEAAAEAALATLDHNELSRKMDAEAEAKVAEGEDPPQHFSESSVFENYHQRALSIGTHRVTKHLTAHHLPGYNVQEISLSSCFRHWAQARGAARSNARYSSGTSPAALSSADTTDSHDHGPAAAAAAVGEETGAPVPSASEAPSTTGTPAAASPISDAPAEDPSTAQIDSSHTGGDQVNHLQIIKPSSDFSSVLEDKLQQKMEKHMALAKLAEQIKACQLEEEVLGEMRETKADKSDLQELVDQAEEMQAMLHRLEDDTKAACAQAEAAMVAAMAAGQGSSGPSISEPAALVQPATVDLSEQDAMLEKLRTQLDGLEGTMDDQNKAAQERLAGLQKKIDPLTGLPYDVDKLRLEELPDKASQSELDKLRLAQEQALEDMKALANSQMTPEMEAALAELMSMRDMKRLVGEQGRQLADLFSTKVGGDDLKKVTDELAATDKELQERLDAHVQELVTQFQEAKEAQAAQLGELDATVSAKADKQWMDSLEREIIAEVERLRAAGKSVITKPELEKRLAELRSKIGKASGTEVGSAAFRCIACNRPLPDMSQWHIDLAGSTHNTKVHPVKPKFGTKELAGMPQHEIVLRGGFPMVNPKVKSKDRRVVGHDLRLFGRNMVDISDEGQIELGGPKLSTGSSSRRASSRRSNPVSSLSSPQSLAPLDDKGTGRRRGSPVPPMHLNMRPETSHSGARHASPWPSSGTPNSFGSISPDPNALQRHQKVHRPQTSPSPTEKSFSSTNAAAAARLQAQRAV